MASEKQASWSLNLEGNVQDEALAAANALESFRKRVTDGQQSIKEMSGALRNLRGSSADVRAAKSELAAKIQAEKQAISEASLAIVKAGSSYEKLTAQAKKLAAEQEKLAEQKTKAVTSAVKAAGGPVAELKERLGQLGEVFGSSSGAAGLLTLAAAGLAAAVAAVTVAVVAGAVALGKWLLESANAARSANLVREAVTGTAASAKNLGDHIADLGSKVTASREKLQELALGLAKTRLSGQAIVDTFNLVGQAADAMGDDVGRRLQDIVTRGQMAGRLQINPQELIGTGVDFKGVAGELAKQMKVGVKDAQKALFEGRVKLEDGAKALRAAVEKRFGEINARRALDMNTQFAKFKETLVGLTRDVNLEPLLRAVASFAKNFDESTVTGSALKTLITALGNGLTKVFVDGAPFVNALFKGLVIGALTGAIAFLKLRKVLSETFDKKGAGDIDWIATALWAGKAAATVLTAAVLGLVVSFQLVKTMLEGSRALVVGLVDAFVKAADWIRGLDWKELGLSIVEGLANGLLSAPDLLINAAVALADKVKSGFTGALKIHSPSKVFEEYGRQTTEGYVQGVDGSAGEAQGAVAAMAPVPGGAGGGAPGAGGGRPEIHVHLHAEAGASPETVQKLQEPSFIAQFTKAVEDLLVQSGAGAAV